MQREGCKGNKVIVSVIETSREYLGRFERGVDLANGKRGTSAYRVADTGERKGLPGKAVEGNQRQKCTAAEEGSSILFVEAMTLSLMRLGWLKLSCLECPIHETSR